MLNVEKIIRVLGYIIYTALWSPFIVLVAVTAPIMLLIIAIRNGLRISEVMRWYWTKLKEGFKHDKKFIDTGVWDW